MPLTRDEVITIFEAARGTGMKVSGAALQARRIIGEKAWVECGITGLDPLAQHTMNELERMILGANVWGPLPNSMILRGLAAGQALELFTILYNVLTYLHEQWDTLPGKDFGHQWSKAQSARSAAEMREYCISLRGQLERTQELAFEPQQFRELVRAGATIYHLILGVDPANRLLSTMQAGIDHLKVHLRVVWIAEHPNKVPDAGHA